MAKTIDSTRSAKVLLVLTLAAFSSLGCKAKPQGVSQQEIVAKYSKDLNWILDHAVRLEVVAYGDFDDRLKRVGPLIIRDRDVVSRVVDIINNRSNEHVNINPGAEDIIYNKLWITIVAEGGSHTSLYLAEWYDLSYPDTRRVRCEVSAKSLHAALLGFIKSRSSLADDSVIDLGPAMGDGP